MGLVGVGYTASRDGGPGVHPADEFSQRPPRGDRPSSQYDKLSSMTIRAALVHHIVHTDCSWPRARLLI